MTNASDAPEKADPRIICFERREDDEAFESSVVALMGRMQEQSRKMFVSEHNVLRMNHGANWVHAAREPEPDTTMHTLSAEWLIPFKEIADNDLGLIGRTILPINEEMEKQFAQNMYGVVGAAAEKVGNVVSAQAAGSFSQSILEMFSKIQLGVDRDGNVSMPQIHVGPEMAERIASEMQNVPPEIEAEIEKIKAEKIQAALVREAERKSKFKQADQ
ncbi:hypothetical protein [Sphingomonas oleivorans]|nr:hypothetical protein [Sphingomonas oleivorans]